MAFDLRAKQGTRTHDGPIGSPRPSGTWLTDAKKEAEESSEREIMIDLSQVQRIASDELCELIRLQLTVKHSDQRLVLCNVQETVMQVFNLTRLDRLIELRLDPPQERSSPPHLPK